MTTFGKWVKAALELDDSVSSAIEVGILLAARSVEALNTVKPRFDEETLTGAMIGALVASHPMGVAAFPDEPGGVLQWASYGKHDRGNDGERSSGADFALVMMVPNMPPRLAIFQAKSDSPKSAKSNKLIVGQIKRRGVQLDFDGFPVAIVSNQVSQLVRTAKRIASKNGFGSRISDLSWVHYLGHFEEGVRAISIADLENEVRYSIKNVSAVAIDVSKKRKISLGDILMDSLASHPMHWLELRGDLGSDVPSRVDLSALVQLMPVVIGGSGGEREINLDMGDGEPTILTKDISTELSPTLDSMPDRGNGPSP